MKSTEDEKREAAIIDHKLIYNVDKNASSAVIKCRINGTLCNTLLDSGAGCSLIDQDLLTVVGHFNLNETTCKLHDASGNVIPIIGTVKMPVIAVGTKHPKEVTFYISRSKSNLIILGRDYMENFDTVTWQGTR